MQTSHIPTKATLTLFALANGEQKELATVFFSGGDVSISGPDARMVEQLQAGVQDPLTGEPITMEDGYEFLVVLEQLYTSPYLFTTGIHKGD